MSVTVIHPNNKNPASIQRQKCLEGAVGPAPHVEGPGGVTHHARQQQTDLASLCTMQWPWNGLLSAAVWASLESTQTRGGRKPCPLPQPGGP